MSLWLHALLLLIGLSHAGAVNAAKTKQTLTINTAVVPPYSTHERNGFEDLLAQEVYKRAGYVVKLSHLPSERALNNIDTGIDDGCLSRVSGLEKIYPNLRRMQEPAVTWQFVAFTKQQNIKINSWDDLGPYNVAYLYGWKIFDLNVKRYKSLKRVRQPGQLYKLLESGRVDIILHALRPGEFFINTLGLRGVQALRPPLAIRKKYFYLNKKHAALLRRANQALLEIKRDGTYQHLYERTIKKVQPGPGKR